jgi:predicted phage tail protein
MTNIIIGGHLGGLIGKEWNMKVRTFRELFGALNTNTEGVFRRYMIGNLQSFAIFCDGVAIDTTFFLDQNIRNKKVLIVPVLTGDGPVAAGIAVGAGANVMLSATVTTAISFKIAVFVTSTIISAAISFGISFLMSKLLDADDPEQINTSSFIFSSPENTSNQGDPVPIGYGRMRIGSNVISASISNIDRSRFDNLNENDLFSSISSNPEFSKIESKSGSFSTKIV